MTTGTTTQNYQDDSSRPATAATGVHELLQPVVADLIVLSLYGKNAHWNINGPGFRSAHRALDEFVATTSSAADSVAERLRALGHAVDGSPQAVAVRAQSMPSALPPVGFVVPETVRWMADLTDDVTTRIRGAVGHIAAVDAPTGDQLNAVVIELEKQAWLLRSEL